MQVVFKDENERTDSKRTSVVSINIYVGRVSRYLERECIREFLEEIRNKERIWRKRWGVKEGIRVEEAWIGIMNYRGIYPDIQKSSKR